MKIIYIVNARIPTEKAHGYQICKMCEEFSSQDIEVELWIPARNNHIESDAFSFYGLKNNFKILTIKNYDFFTFHEYLGKLSFWLQGLSIVLRLMFIRVDKNAIIYTREPEIGLLFNLRGYKTVYEAHTWPENRVWLYKFLIKKLDKVVAITHGLANFFIKAGYAENKILVAPDGVDLNRFDINLKKIPARKKLNLPLDKKIILYTGHLYEWKGVEDLAWAAGLLDYDCLVVFVGGVETDANIFKEEYSELIDNGKIAIYKHQQHEFIPVWLKAADILVLPNKDQENISKFFTSPLKLFEYMASGVSIVASDLPSIREILSEKNCLFFQPNDPRDLAKKIGVLLNNKELAAKIAEQAYFDVKNYTWEKRARSIINFIN